MCARPDQWPLRAREAAALTATGRWAYYSALARAESRGMQRRLDAPGTDPVFVCAIETSRARPRHRSRAAPLAAGAPAGDDRDRLETALHRVRYLRPGMPGQCFRPAYPMRAPVIARQEDCQTCFLCEIYCPTDALYVAPNAEGPTANQRGGNRESGACSAAMRARSAGTAAGPAAANNDPTFRLRAASR